MDKDVLKKIYLRLRNKGRMDKEDVLNLLGLEYTNWNMRKALNYLKDLANEFKDVSLKKGEKGKYYIEIENYNEVVKNNLNKSFNSKKFEKEFWNAVYYIIIYENENSYKVIEAVEISNFEKILSKYNINDMGEWISLKLKEDDLSGVGVDYVGDVLDINKFNLFTKDINKKNINKYVSNKAVRQWTGRNKEGDIIYYNIIKCDNILYVFELSTIRIYNKDGEIFTPGRVIIYNLDIIDIDKVYEDLKGNKRQCSNIIYVVRDFDRRMILAEEKAKEKLNKIFNA
ncbi:MAG TPA: hypothetical protein EYH22_01790 [Candidatus Nanopusillus sp.]|nr:hypothetical protein [Candidatus Nanopusillus sp.]